MRNSVVMRTARGVIAMVIAGACIGGSIAAEQRPTAKKRPADVERGHYLVAITGCNDCHTPGYPESGGKVDEKLWLTGSPLGWRGPWGTTYASNLRLVVQNMNEAQWLKHARNEWRPPMPWFSLRHMSDADLKAVYRYLRYMGPAGERAPAYVPPDGQPKQPFVQFPAPPK